jgi:hypothetical protein
LLVLEGAGDGASEAVLLEATQKTMMSDPAFDKAILLAGPNESDRSAAGVHRLLLSDSVQESALAQLWVSDEAKVGLSQGFGSAEFDSFNNTLDSVMGPFLDQLFGKL